MLAIYKVYARRCKEHLDDDKNHNIDASSLNYNNIMASINEKMNDYRC